MIDINVNEIAEDLAKLPKWTPRWVLTCLCFLVAAAIWGAIIEDVLMEGK